MSDESLAARLAELEARYTLHQDLLDKLSDVIWRQQRDLDKLGARAVALEKRLAALSGEAAEAPDPGDEVPPHY
jgi:SlyX protein